MIQCSFFRLFVLATIVFSSFGFKMLSAQTPVIVWQKCMGGSGYDNGLGVTATIDGGAAVVGNTTSNDGDVTVSFGDYDVWVVKLDASGNIEWQKSYGGSALDEGDCIRQTADHGYIVAGSSSSKDGDITGNHDSSDLWIFKIDSVGALQWEKAYGGSSDEWLPDLQLTEDGGYIISGTTASHDGDVTNNYGLADYWIVKIDSAGNIEWQKTFGGSDFDEAFSIHNSSDHGFLICGLSTSNDLDVSGNHGGSFDYWIIKIDSAGNLQWQKSLGGSSDDWCFGITEGSNSAILSVGFSSSDDGDVTGNHGGNDMWLTALDTSGALIWEKSLGGSLGDLGGTIIPYQNGFAISGVSASTDGDLSSNQGVSDLWIVGIDTIGNIKWETSLGGDNYERIGYHGIDESPDGFLYVFGTTLSNNGDVTGHHVYEDFWLVKLSNVTGIAPSPPPYVLNVFPSVTHNLVKVFSNHHSGMLEVHDALGHVVSSRIISDEEVVEVALSDFPSGMYLFTLSDEKYQTSYAKVIKQ